MVHLAFTASPSWWYTMVAVPDGWMPTSKKNNPHANRND